MYSEAYSKLTQAIEIERGWYRVTIQPFHVLIEGTSDYLELGGVLAKRQREQIRNYVDEARPRFRSDSTIGIAINRLDSLL